MTFEEILDQAIAMLQRRGRVTYRTLRLQFQLDEEKLEALKEALLDAERLAIDEEGRVLVWTGPPASPPTASATRGTPQDHPPGPPPPVAEVPTTAAGQVPRPSDAERRQLTVMFCDLVDSTTLSSQLDPEEYRDVVRAYQRVCAEVITRLDGHIAQLLGDGLLMYFGYPQAHEDDALRAVHTGLGIIEVVEALNTSLEPAKGITLAVRLGIHTGLVVVGDMGGAGRQEQLALGEVPNIASRLQGLAASNTIAIGEATYRLVQGYFDCEALGAQTLRGVAEPLNVYRILRESGVHSRLDIAGARGLTPLVGRESEVTLLLERWEQVKAGQGQVILLRGDAGIGKSRLVQMLKEHVAHEPHTRWECRSVEYYQNTALFPVTDLFQRLVQFHAEDTLDTKLGKLEHALSQYRLPVEESVQLFAPLLSLSLPEHHYPPLNLSPQRQRQKTLETLVAILQELAEHQPVLCILEDLHWTDPTTLEWLNLMIDQTPTASVLVLLTCRPHFQPAWHHRSYLTEITVNRLSHAQVEQIVNRMIDGKALPQEVLAQIVEKTDGVPLFVEEMTKAILESGQLKTLDGHYELMGALSTLAIPATLHDSLMARLDRLVTAKAVAQYAAVIGRQFAYDLLSTVSQLDEATLQRELGRLVEAEIVYQRDMPPQATYVFKHALIQDAAYQSLLKSTRQQYHQRIAQVLEAQFPETAEAQPELVAYHYTEAGLSEQAIGYWQQAGQRASERSAYAEAIHHLTKGLELVSTLADPAAQAKYELALQLALGAALEATRGWAAPEVGHAYARAQEVCQQMADAPEHFRVLYGLWNFHLVRGELLVACDLGAQLLHLAQQQHDVTHAVEAHFALATALMFHGAVAATRTHVEESLRLSDRQQDASQTSRIIAGTRAYGLIVAGWALWWLGYPDQAAQRADEALTHTQELAHPVTLTWVLCQGAIISQFRRAVPATYERAEAAIALGTARGFQHVVAWSMVLRGWALAMQGQGEAGITQMRQGLTDWQRTGAEMDRPHLLALLAERYATVGQPEHGLSLLTEALAAVEAHEQRFYEAELYRLKGVLLLAQSADQHAEAADCLQQALLIARHQQARSLELRIAISLSRLWHQQGKHQEAHDLLAPVYHWFTEGLDTADLQDAKALLEALA